MDINIEEIICIMARRKEINSIPLSKIRFFSGGERVIIDRKILKGWKFTGMNNVDFIYTGFYKEGFKEEADSERG